MKKEFLFISLILITSLLSLSGCGKESEKITNAPEIPNQPQETKEFDISVSNWEFEPSTITVKEGLKVILHVNSKDGDHGIAINEFGISEELNSGETVDIEFIANKKGEFLIFCNVFCGEGHSNMEGTLIVE